MSDRISISWDALMRQSWMTAHDGMMHAIEDVEKLFGADAASKYPELIVAHMQASTSDFQSTAISIAGQNIKDGLQSIADALKKEDSE